MGILRDSIFKEKNETLAEELIRRGDFVNGSGAQGHKGLCTQVKKEDGTLYWITVNLDTKMLYIYVETEYSAHLWHEDYKIEDKYLKNFDTIIDFIDDRL